MTALPTCALTWPATSDPDPRWPHRVLAALADDHTDLTRAHQQLTGLLDELTANPHSLTGAELAAHLTAIAHTATTRHDHTDLRALLDQHGHPHAVACLARLQHHRINALQALRHHADRASHGHTPAGAHAHLTRALADLDAAGAALTDADHTLIRQLEEEIGYAQQPQPPTRPEPNWGDSVSETGEFRRASSVL